MRITLGDGTCLFVDQLTPALRIEPDKLVDLPELLLIHGGPGSDHSAMRPFFSRLGDVVSVVAFDQRGMGRSDRSTPSAWTLDQWTEDALSLVEILGLERPILLGQSFGGYVALRMAAAAPSRFRGVVLSSSQTRPDPKETVARFRERGGDDAADAAEAFFADPSSERYERYRRLCFPLYNTTPRDPGLAAREHTTPEVLIHFWRGEYRDLNLDRYLEAVRAPALVIAGSDDPIVPAHRSKAIAKGLVNSQAVEYVVIEGAGHGPYRDRPDLYESYLRRFVASVE